MIAREPLRTDPGRRRDRRGWPGRVRTGGCARPGRRRGPRAGAAAGLALAGRWRVQLPGDGRRAAARGARRGGAGSRRAAHPAMRLETPGGAVVRLDVRRGDRRTARGRLRPVRARSGPAALAVEAGRRHPARHRGRDHRSRRRTARRIRVRSAAGTETIRCRVVVGADGRALDRGAAGGRRPPDPPPRAGRPQLPPRGPATGRAAWTRACACSTAATSASHLCPAGGSISGSCWVRHGGNGWPATVRSPRPTPIVAAVPPTPDDPATWRDGERCDHLAGASPLGGRVDAPRRAGLVPRRRRRRGSSTRSPVRDSIARSCRASSPRVPSGRR